MRIREAISKMDTWLICILGALLIVSKTTGFASLLWIGVILTFVAVFRRTEEYNFYFSIFLIANLRIFDDIGTSFLVNLCMVMPLVPIVFRKKFKLNKYAVLFGGLFILVEFFHEIALNNLSSFLPMLCWGLGWILCVEVLLDSEIKLSRDKTFWYFAGGIIFSSVVYWITRATDIPRLMSLINQGYRFSGFSGEPNYYAMYICIALAMICGSRVIIRQHFWTYLALMLIGLLTVSKMFLIELVLISVVMVFQIFDRDLKRRRLVISIASTCFIGSVLFRGLIEQYIDKMLQRANILNGSITSIERLTSGRSAILSDYMNVLSNKIDVLLVGNGMQYHELLSGAGAHNTYLDIILSWGVTGFIVAIISMISLSQNVSLVRGKMYSRIQWLPIIVLLLNFLDLSCFSAGMFFWVIALCLVRDDIETST